MTLIYGHVPKPNSGPIKLTIKFKGNVHQRAPLLSESTQKRIAMQARIRHTNSRTRIIITTLPPPFFAGAAAIGTGPAGTWPE